MGHLKPPSIELHIEELVLHGFAPGNRYEIAAAVQQELVHLLSEQGISPEYVVSDEKIDAGAFALPQDAKAKRIGAQIAQSIYGGFKTEGADTTRSQPTMDHNSFGTRS